MSTQTIMKARIADELARGDLTSQIAYAIGDAIEAYEDERYFFNETRANTFSTVIDQEFYDADDAAFLGTMQKIDYIMVLLGDQPFELLPLTPARMEWSSTNGTSTGQPSWFTWYNSQLRLYPVPAGVWTIRMAGSVKIAAPATDGEADNPWMTHGARLIRSRAKLELALHVLHDREMAATLSEAVTEADSQLTARSAQIMQVGKGRIKAMEL